MYQLSGCAASKVVCFARAFARALIVIFLKFCHAMMVLIESSGRELSIGCHIVRFALFGLY